MFSKDLLRGCQVPLERLARGSPGSATKKVKFERSSSLMNIEELDWEETPAKKSSEGGVGNAGSFPLGKPPSSRLRSKYRSPSSDMPPSGGKATSKTFVPNFSGVSSLLTYL